MTTGRVEVILKEIVTADLVAALVREGFEVETGVVLIVSKKSGPGETPEEKHARIFS